MEPPPQSQQKLLLSSLESARRHSSDLNQRAVQISLDIGKEKTQFFEKIALASGGTVALVVSFIGAHKEHLQPPWLLRSALIALVLSMVSATYRNWRFPFYVIAVYGRQYLEAKREAMYRERDYVHGTNALTVDDAGKSVTLDDFNKQLAEDEKTFDKKIKECKQQEDTSFKVVQFIEHITLGLITAGMAMLVGLAWRNF
jgi:hypothetical protein